MLETSIVGVAIFNENEKQRHYLTLHKILSLTKPNLERFIKILNIVTNYDDLGNEIKFGKLEF